jgi:hypothetical protein
MRTRARVRSLVLAAVLQATALALAPAGVRVARAEGAAPPPARSFTSVVSDGAASCREGGAARAAGQQAALERMRAALRRQARAGDEQIVVLDGRGYNYRKRPDPLGALGVIEHELRR